MKHFLPLLLVPILAVAQQSAPPKPAETPKAAAAPTTHDVQLTDAQLKALLLLRNARLKALASNLTAEQQYRTTQQETQRAQQDEQAAMDDLSKQCGGAVTPRPGAKPSDDNWVCVVTEKPEAATKK